MLILEVYIYSNCFSKIGISFFLPSTFSINTAIFVSSFSFSYKFLHNEVWSEVHLTEPPVRVGVLLDYRKGRLSFYNVQKGQLLFTFRHRFTEAAHPTFALEAQGEIHLHTGIELPHFARHS